MGKFKNSTIDVNGSNLLNYMGLSLLIFFSSSSIIFFFPHLKLPNLVKNGKSQKSKSFAPRSDHHVRLFDRLGFGLKYPSKVDSSHHILIKVFYKSWNVYCSI
jgi:hypothetical protein